MRALFLTWGRFDGNLRPLIQSSTPWRLISWFAWVVLACAFCMVCNFADLFLIVSSDGISESEFDLTFHAPGNLLGFARTAVNLWHTIDMSWTALAEGSYSKRQANHLMLVDLHINTTYSQNGSVVVDAQTWSNFYLESNDFGWTPCLFCRQDAWKRCLILNISRLFVWFHMKALASIIFHHASGTTYPIRIVNLESFWGAGPWYVFLGRLLLHVLRR